MDPPAQWTWSTVDVVEFFATLDETREIFQNDKLVRAFEENQVDGSVIFTDTLSHQILIEFGVKSLGHRVTILQVAAFLQNTFPGYEIWRNDQRRQAMGLPALFFTRSREPVEVEVEYVPQQVYTEQPLQSEQHSRPQVQIGPSTPELCAVIHPHVSKHIPVNGWPLIVDFSDYMETNNNRDNENNADRSTSPDPLILPTKRIAPTCVVPLLDYPTPDDDDDIELQPNAAMSEEDIDEFSQLSNNLERTLSFTQDAETEMIDDKKAQRRRIAKVAPYLSKLSVDEMFYGVFEESLDKEWSKENRPYTGTSRYASRRMTHFLAEKPIAEDSHSAQAFRPFPSRFIRRYQKWPITLIDAEGKIFRSKNIKNYIQRFPGLAPGLTIEKIMTKYKSKDRMILADVSDPRDAVWVNPYQDPNGDSYYDYLLARYGGSPGHLLPVYGDSGSEGSDPETLNLLEREARTRARKRRIRLNQPLDEQELDAIIDTTLDAIAAKWTAKMSKDEIVLETKAYRLWKKSRKRGNWSRQIRELKNLNAKLQERLENQRKEIKLNRYFSEKEVQKLVKGTFSVTVEESENNAWQISVLKGTKPQRPERRLEPETTGMETDGSDVDSILSAGDSESNEDDNGDASFVVGDDGFIVGDDICDEGFEHLNDNVFHSDEVDNVDEMEVDLDDKPTPKRPSLFHEHSRDKIGDRFTPVLDDDVAGDSNSDDFEDERRSPSKQCRRHAVILSDDEHDEPMATGTPPPMHIKNERSPTKAFSPLEADANIIDLTQVDDAPQKVPQSKKRAREIIRSDGTSSASASTSDSDFKHKRRKSSALDPVIINDDENNEGDTLAATISKLSWNSEGPSIPFVLVDEDEDMETAIRLSLEDQDTSFQLLKENLNAIVGFNETELKRITELASIPVKDLLPTLSNFTDQMGTELKSLRSVPGVSATLKPAYMRLAKLFALHILQLPRTDSVFLNSIQKEQLRDLNNLQTFMKPLHRLLDIPEKIALQELIDVSRPKKKKNKPSSAYDLVLSEEEAEISQSQAHRKNRKEAKTNLEGAARREKVQKALQLQQQRAKRSKKKGVKSNECDFLINDGHYATVNPVYIPEEWTGVLQPHQVDGIRFLWGQLVGVGAVKKDEQRGALLAHTMGMGKTMQVIVLLYMIAKTGQSKNNKDFEQIPKHLRTSRTLILAPPGLLQNWKEEFAKWLYEDEDEPKVLGDVFVLDSKTNRFDRIQAWKENGGILLVGYATFRICVLEAEAYDKKLAQRNDGILTAEEQEELNQLKEMQKTLLECANIVVADEAHTIKNKDTVIARIVKRFTTPSRIAMTGSPLANNLEEYYAVINWVDPLFLGDLPEFRAKYVYPIEDGLYADSTPAERSKSKVQLKALRKALEPKMHRRGIDQIKDKLPEKTEFLISVPLTPLQEKLYSKYTDLVLINTRHEEVKGFLDFIRLLSLILSHPSIFRAALEIRLASKKSKNIQSIDSEVADADADIDADLDEAQLAGPQGGEELPSEDANLEHLIGNVNGNMLERCRPLFDEMSEDVISLEHSYRMKALVRILEGCVASEKKTLVFTKSIPTFKHIEKLLLGRNIKHSKLLGKTKMSSRQSLCKSFNEGKGGVVFLISTKAGALGLNLQGASRVIIVDFDWSPQWEEQAIGRAYRLNQKEHVFVYRFKVAGTYEDILHNRSLFKMQLASRVVDKKDPTRAALRMKGKEWFRPPTLDIERKDLTRFLNRDPLVLASLLKSEDYFLDIVLQETYEAHHEEPLTAEENELAQQAYQEDEERRRMSRLPASLPVPTPSQGSPASQMRPPQASQMHTPSRVAASSQRPLPTSQVPTPLRTGTAPQLASPSSPKLYRAPLPSFNGKSGLPFQPPPPRPDPGQAPPPL